LGAHGFDSARRLEPRGEGTIAEFEADTAAISLRLPVHLLEAIKIEANKRDVPYQSLIKMWLGEKVTS
jgi:predicted DNA binding CopG/RHH family protein